MEGDIQVQYQAILFMKNSLTRLLQMHRNRKRYSRGVVGAAVNAAAGANPSLSATLNNLPGVP